jgi:pimeloyl-ACP methyl ester carboxylesterase
MSRKQSMFMIHPGAAGCEVYTPLAKRLSNNFDCYGVDSYNLYHDSKIVNLKDLASYYLSYINKVVAHNNDEVYNLLGWSLGGQIALEIAALLEERNVKNIKLYIIDTVLIDDTLESLGELEDLDKRKDRFINYIRDHKCDTKYIDKMLPNIDIDMQLGQQRISSILKYSKILLFKAMFDDETISEIMVNSKEIAMHIKNLKYNNLDKIVDNLFKIKVLEMSVNHSNILNELDFIYYSIVGPK